MNKIKNKFFGAFLSLGLLATISFATHAQAYINDSEVKKLHYAVEFDYKDKDLEKDRNINLGKLNNDENSLKNKTTAKELVNLYAVMQKMLEKYDIPNKKFKSFKRIDIITPNHRQLKLTGEANITANFSEENIFKNLLNNFNDDIKNIKITQKDFENAKYDLINDIKNELNKSEDDLKDYEGKNLIEIGKVSAKKTIKHLKELKEKIQSQEKMSIYDKRLVESINSSIKNYYEKVLKDDKKAEKEGKLTYKSIKHLKNRYIPNLKQHIKQIKDVKYNDVKNLTKDLKININDIQKREVNDI